MTINDREQIARNLRILAGLGLLWLDLGRLWLRIAAAILLARGAQGA